MDANGPDDDAIAARVDQLVDEHRITYLWFLRSDYYPSTNEERIRVLEHMVTLKPSAEQPR